VSKKYLLPLLVFVLLALFLAAGLKHDPREVPSPLINKPAPAFTLSRLDDPTRHFSPDELRGKPWLLSVWASWCGSCRQEHPLLVDLAQRSDVLLVGLDYKDEPGDAQNWLRQFGNPYMLSVSDSEGRVGIDYGVYGVPETYVIDRDGIIRYKHIGPLTADDIANKLLPLVKRL
jgi:cytochrome c biogenesis protein CcmG, thiol:disulfide interchange protein DsbE